MESTTSTGTIVFSGQDVKPPILMWFKEQRDRRTLSVRSRCRLGPIEHAATFAVPEGPDRNQNEIDQGPNTERPECQQLNDARSDFPEVKTMNAEHAHEDTQQQRRQAGLRGDIGRCHTGSLAGAALFRDCRKY